MTEFGKTPYLSTAEFQAFGFDAVIFPMMAFRLMLRAVADGLAELAATGTQRGLVEKMTTRADLYQLIDYPAWEDYERRFAGI